MPNAPMVGKGFLIALLLVVLCWSGPAHAQQGGGKFKKEIVAVLDLAVTGASPALALAASIRLREELLNSGFFQLVDRQRLKQVLDEQALSQVSCTGTNCTIQVGKITGARIIMTGDVVRLSEDTWQVSAVMTDVETSEVIRAGSVFFEGGAGALIDEGIPQLVGKLVPQGDPEAYGGVVNLLMQKSTELVSGAASELLGIEEDKRTGAIRMKADNRFRTWLSPASYFRYAIRNKENHHLETLYGQGISLGLEREVEQAWALGGSVHMGTLKKRKDQSGASNLILGYYSAWSLYVLDGVPNGHPWFYYGTGLFGFSLNYVDRGENLTARAIGALAMGRLQYLFRSGGVMGIGAETNYLFAVTSDGTRMEQYEAAGEDVSPHAWGMVTYAFLGYTF